MFNELNTGRLVFCCSFRVLFLKYRIYFYLQPYHIIAAGLDLAFPFTFRQRLVLHLSHCQSVIASHQNRDFSSLSNFLLGTQDSGNSSETNRKTRPFLGKFNFQGFLFLFTEIEMTDFDKPYKLRVQYIQMLISLISMAPY